MKLHRILPALVALGLISFAAMAYAGPMNGGQGNCGNHQARMADCPNGGMGYGMGHGMHMGKGFMNSLTPEQQTKYQALYDAYSKKTEDLRSDMWAKHTELEALTGNDKVEPAYITKLVQEMKEIGTKLRAERTAFNAQVEKELGIKNFGRGNGPRVNCPYADAAPAEQPQAPAN